MTQYELFKNIYASHLKSRAITVMSCLIVHMNAKTNTCFPSIKTIATCCSLSVNTVKRALDDLVVAGFIEKEARYVETKNGAQTSNLYRFLLQKVDSKPEKMDEQIKDLDNEKDENMAIKNDDKENVIVETSNVLSENCDTQKVSESCCKKRHINSDLQESTEDLVSDMVHVQTFTFVEYLYRPNFCRTAPP